MMRSLYSAVSGLKNHQTKMDVIGNNIANVNTVAFKSSSVTFSDIIYQTLSGASGATTSLGGINAKQIGLGVNTAATSISITTSGAAQTTGGAFDLRLTDGGNSTNFFIVSNGSDYMFTRDGSFYIDGTGTLCMSSTGYKVLGWQVDDETGDIKEDTVSALSIMQTKFLTSAPEATTKAYATGIVDKNTSSLSSTSGYSMSLTIYDNEGYAYTAKFSIKAYDTDAGQYTVKLASVLDSDGNNLLANYSGALSTLFGTSDATSNTVSYDLTADLKQSWTSTGTVTINDVEYTLYTKDSGATQYAIASDGSSATVYRYDSDNNTLISQTLIDYNDIKALKTGWSYSSDVSGYTGTETAVFALTSSSNTYYVTESGKLVDATGVESTTVTLSDIIDGYDSDYTSSTATTAGVLNTTYTNYLLQFSTADGSFTSIGDTTSQVLQLSNLGSQFADITIDFSALQNMDNSGTSTAGLTRGTSSSDTTGAGKKLGAMTGISVESSGKIYGSYDNGNTVLLGQIAVAQFANASGLEKVGESCYITTLNSGDFDGIGTAIDADGSKMTSGELEMSNVDLSAQFTDMITTQRGFQANSRVITTSDTLLEELINLKR